MHSKFPDSLSPETLADWDSFHQVKLVIAIQEEFGVSLFPRMKPSPSRALQNSSSRSKRRAFSAVGVQPHSRSAEVHPRFAIQPGKCGLTAIDHVAHPWIRWSREK